MGKQLKLSFPIAIGEQIWARAALDRVKHEYDEIRVGLNWTGLEMRPPGYRPFAVGTGQMLFSDAPYHFDEHARDYPYTPFEELHKQGFQLAMPWFPQLLCAPNAPVPQRPYVTLATKVRFWGRPAFDQVYDQFFAVMREVAKKYRIVLMGEREVCRIGEYACWGPDAVYSIYPDIMKQLTVNDRTFPTFAGDDFRLPRLRKNCTLMRNAALNINVGIGGSVALGASVGKLLALNGCGGFAHINALFKLAHTKRILITGDFEEYCERLQQL